MKRVLVVDDEADVLWMLQKNLNKGMPDTEVLVAASGEEALAVLERGPIDLVITDINMPGINGLDLLVEVNNKYPHIGVIIITAYPSNTYQSQAILSGGLKFIEKPFDIKYLRKIVEEFFNPDKQGFQGTISGIDLIDIVQFNGMSRATVALKVTTGDSAGMIFFKDGQVVHAICDQTSGEAAFFTILGFHGGNLKNIKGVETPVVTITKSLELLLLEAVGHDDDVMEDDEAPFLSYDELANEPPPAFLSQRDDDAPTLPLDQEAPAFLSDEGEIDQDIVTLADGLFPASPAVTDDADIDRDDRQSDRTFAAKTSSILSAELRDQRAACATKQTPAPPVAAIPGLDVGDETFSLLTAADVTPHRSDDEESRTPADLDVAGDGDRLSFDAGEIPGLNVDEDESPAALSDWSSSDSPAFLSDDVAEPAAPALSLDDLALTAVRKAPDLDVPTQPAAPTSSQKTAVGVKFAPTVGRIRAIGAAIKAGKPARSHTPLDAILSEFTGIDGVRLACLVGRDGFLLASQPPDDRSQAEALSAVASSGLASAEFMGEELARSSLQTGLFEYQDGMIILSPVGTDSFLMLVAEEGANLGWLRLVIRKNAGRIEEINAQ
ncbi:MAG: response regulator [Desulfobulbaceae bacterium]|jgi:CheY-like chemotaxis protein/predicted regulator of Ras-like GTPase activity (Roadblock/LC7/MglB family)|nr:response regulator [Desulfobulbaceae bacterium]